MNKTLYEKNRNQEKNCDQFRGSHWPRIVVGHQSRNIEGLVAFTVMGLVDTFGVSQQNLKYITGNLSCKRRWNEVTSRPFESCNSELPDWITFFKLKTAQCRKSIYTLCDRNGSFLVSYLFQVEFMNVLKLSISFCIWEWCHKNANV